MKKFLLASILLLSAVVINAQVPSLQEGIKHMENENYAAALNVFNSIAKNDPKNGTIYFYIGEVGYLTEDYPAAKKSYEKGLSINPQCAECKVGLGRLLLDEAKTSEATEQFESAMRMDKKNADIFYLVGTAYLDSKKPDGNKAVKYLSDARDMNPKKANYWARLGDAYKLIGNNGEAMTAFETAVGKDSTITSAYISMARIWAAAKQLDIAIPLLEKAIRLSPNDARAYKDLIELYIQDGQYDKVTPLLDKYVSLIGTDVDAKVRLVKFLTFQAKDYDRAIMEGEKLLKTNPEQYTLHRWLAWAYAEKGDYQNSYNQSKQLFDDIGKKEGRATYPSDYDYWAKAAFKLGLIDDAAHIYRKYLELDTTRKAEIYGMLAKAYYDIKNWEQAIAYYNRKAEIKALSVGEEYYLGISYYYFDKNTEADTSFAKVLRITPDYAPAWLMRARIADSKDSLETKLYLAKEYYENYITHALKDKEKESTKKNIITASYYLAEYWVNQVGNKDTKSACEIKQSMTFTLKEWDEYALTKAKESYELILSLNSEDQIAIDNLKIVADNIKLVREQKRP